VTLDFREEGEHPSVYTLTRHHAGDLPEAERQRIAGHLEGCQACAAVLAELVETKKNFQAEISREVFLTRVRVAAEKTPESGGFWRGLLRPAMALAAAAVVALILVLVPWQTNQDPGERLKGGPIELGYYVMEDSGPVVATPGRVLHPGDRIQFRLTAPAGGYVHVVGIDPKNEVTVYFPLPNQAAKAFPGGAGRPVPGSVYLDDTLGEEKVFVLICVEPLSRDMLIGKLTNAPGGPEALRQANRLPLKCRQASLVLRKE